MKEQITDTKNDEKKSSIQFQIYRFKFSVILTDQLLYFSKLHQDGNNTFLCAGIPFSTRSFGIGPSDLKYFL